MKVSSAWKTVGLAAALLVIVGPWPVMGARAVKKPGGMNVKPSTTTETRSNPDAHGVYHAGTGVVAPELLRQVDADYSEKARKSKISGNCDVLLVIDKVGQPQDVRVVKSVAEGNPAKLRAAALSLDEKAVEAVRQYRFKPATFEGKPVPFEMTIGVSFEIQ